MSARIFFAFVSFLLINTAYADLGVHSTVKVPEPVFDFGSVSQGATITHDFKIQNTGNAVLRVNKIVPSCGCTAGTMDPEKIKPGESGVIHVSFDTAGFSGNKVKTVRLYTNDPFSESVLLTLKGSIEPDTRIEPRQLLFNDVIKDGESILNAEQVLTISVREGAGVTLGTVKTYAPHIEIKELSSSATQKRLQISIAPSAPKGEIRDKIIVQVKGGKRNSINVPVYAVVSGSVKASQSVISFGVITGTDIVRRSIKISNRGETPVHITEVLTPHDSISASVVEAQKGKDFVLHIDLDPTKLKGDLKGTVRVLTDSLETKSIPVSLIGIQPPQS